MQQVETLWESRLDAVVLMQLHPHHNEADDTFVDIILDDLELDEPEELYYATYLLIHDPQATTEFVRVRDTSHDHIVTVKFPFAALDADTQPIPLVSTPYDKIDIAECSAQFTAYAGALPLPTYSAPFERVDLEALAVPAPIAHEETEMIEAPRSRLFETIFVLTCALFFGMTVVYYAFTK
jgi:hypothetical protein